MNIKYYLTKIIKDGHFWQRTDVLGEVVRQKFFFTAPQLVILIIAVIIHLYFRASLNEAFVGYAINALAIFVGLFLTLNLSVFDKYKILFDGIEIKIKTMNQAQKVGLIKRKNFFKQFTSLVNYAILISVMLIALLSLRLSLASLNNSIAYYQFVGFSALNGTNVLCFFKLVAISIYNIGVLYFLCDVLLMILYALGSIHNFLMAEYETFKITTDN